MINFISVERIIKELDKFIGANILSFAFLFPFLLGLLLIIASYVLSIKYSNSNGGHEIRKWRLILATLSATDLRLRQFLFFLFSTLFLWITYWFFISAKLYAQPLRIITLLFTAWSLIRFLTAIIDKSFTGKIVASIIWLMTALSISDLMNPMMEILDKFGIKLGTFNLSALTIVKGVVIFSLFFWGIGFLGEILEKRLHRLQGLTETQRILASKTSRIIMILVAVLVGLQIIGIDVTTLTIFSGAVGFGLGFGLQKVFSNIICGLILLTDKSIKPGDVIAIANTFGVVNTLEARYVSVVTLDGKNHLIPNELLITERVENWSYDNNLLRIYVPVGVSYDSDPYLVKDLLLQAALKVDRVLQDPPSRALLVGFGDSSLNFELHIWIQDIQNGQASVKDALLFAIWELFKQHNIEIPYPHSEVRILKS